jgi:hypothetical protein
MSWKNSAACMIVLCRATSTCRRSKVYKEHRLGVCKVLQVHCIKQKRYTRLRTMGGNCSSWTLAVCGQFMCKIDYNWQMWHLLLHKKRTLRYSTTLQLSVASRSDEVSSMASSHKEHSSPGSSMLPSLAHSSCAVMKELRRAQECSSCFSKPLGNSTF